MTGVRQDVVLFAEAWDSGASTWSTQRPEAYANHLGDATSLVASTARSNQSKSGQDPAEHLPPAGEAHCRYHAEWEGMKLRWARSADEAKPATLREVAGGCLEQTVTHEPNP
ncbi:HNH endonuclease OS=Streptomyces tendae OX=1932 GN=GUR47_38225 PE=4 SV=1 [Streptomyces tendae]